MRTIEDDCAPGAFFFLFRTKRMVTLTQSFVPRAIKLTFKEKLSQKKILTSELTINSPVVDRIKQFFLKNSKRRNKK